MTVATDDARAADAQRAALSAPRRSAPARPPMAITNRGDTPAWRAVSITGVPKADLPAESKRLCGDPQVFRPDGTRGRSEQGAADRSVRRRHQGHAHRRVASRRRPWSSICCRPASRSRRRRCRRAARTTGLFLAPGTDRRDLHRAARRPLHRRARPRRRHQGLHARLCRARRDARANSNTRRSSPRTCTSPRPPAAPRSAS